MVAVAGAVLLAGCQTPSPETMSPDGGPAASVPGQSGLPSALAEKEWADCAGDGYTIAYPADWFVHPPDLALGVRECALFAAEPFGGQAEFDGGWAGAQIVLWAPAGCIGSFDAVLSEEELEIQGFPAWKREVAPGEGLDRGQLSAYAYFVNLTPGVPCETSRSFLARTELAAPGDHAENRRILDEMMESLRFGDHSSGDVAPTASRSAAATAVLK